MSDREKFVEAAADKPKIIVVLFNQVDRTFNYCDKFSYLPYNAVLKDDDGVEYQVRYYSDVNKVAFATLRG
jgi:hypothetical protein